MSLYILAGGGSGGHLYPGLAVAEEILRRRPGAKIVFACSQRDIDRRILTATPYAIAPLPIRPLAGGPLKLVNFCAKMVESMWRARRMLKDLQPSGVLGLGGFASVPVTWWAAKMGFRAGILNPDAVAGKANRLLAKSAECVFTQFECTAEHLPKRARGRVQLVGCPIRSGLTSGQRTEAIEHFGLLKTRKTLLVFGASLGATSINAAVGELVGDLDRLASRWQVLLVTGQNKTGLSDTPLRHAGIRVRTRAYCDRMDLAYAAADLAVCRAGAGVVAELAATATPAVVMPYPHHADDHQRRNAEALARAGGAVICTDLTDAHANAAALREVLLPAMEDDARLGAMSSAAGSVGRPDAAAAVADWLCPQAPLSITPNRGGRALR